MYDIRPYLPKIPQAVIFAGWLGVFFTGCAVDGNSSSDTTKLIESESMKPKASLANTYWKLLEIYGESAVLGDNQKEVNLITSGGENHVHGFSGCNQFSGGYKLRGDHLEFERVATTRMACIDGMEQETLFLEALNSVKRFSIHGEKLTLYDNQNQAILQFLAVYLR